MLNIIKITDTSKYKEKQQHHHQQSLKQLQHRQERNL